MFFDNTETFSKFLNIDTLPEPLETQNHQPFYIQKRLLTHRNVSWSRSRNVFWYSYRLTSQLSTSVLVIKLKETSKRFKMWHITPSVPFDEDKTTTAKRPIPLSTGRRPSTLKEEQYLKGIIFPRLPLIFWHVNYPRRKWVPLFSLMGFLLHFFSFLQQVSIPAFSQRVSRLANKQPLSCVSFSLSPVLTLQELLTVDFEKTFKEYWTRFVSVTTHLTNLVVYSISLQIINNCLSLFKSLKKIYII